MTAGATDIIDRPDSETARLGEPRSANHVRKWSPAETIAFAGWLSLGLWLLIAVVARAIWLAVS